jgi:hypothetical protein
MSKVRYLEVTIEKSMKYFRKNGEKSQGMVMKEI